MEALLRGVYIGQNASTAHLGFVHLSLCHYTSIKNDSVRESEVGKI